jgi:hypothetical protein
MSANGPVFVVGCPRSGTSALSWALASHPEWWTSVETHFYYYLLRDNSFARAWSQSRDAGSWLEVHDVSGDEFLAHAGTGFDRMMRSRSEGLNWVDGSPENLMVADPLLRMFPDARMFHVVRSPQAVCLSMLTSGFREPWARDLGAAIETWKHYVSTGLSLVRTFPERVTRIRQEDMRASPGRVAIEIGGHLGLEDVEPISAFLACQKINSSFDKTSYSEFGPRLGAETVLLDPEEFYASHGARIWEETAALASQCGYNPS